MPRFIDEAKISFRLNTLRDQDSEVYVCLRDVLHCIHATPTADVEEVKRGKWIPYKGGGQKCNICGVFAEKMTKRCPECGAKMGGIATDEERI